MAGPDAKRNAAIGCFVTPLGAASGAMVGVLLSVVVAYFTRAQACPDIPSCNWAAYAGAGALLGGLSLPFLVVRRLLQAPAPGADRPPAGPGTGPSSF